MSKIVLFLAFLGGVAGAEAAVAVVCAQGANSQYVWRVSIDSTLGLAQMAAMADCRADMRRLGLQDTCDLFFGAEHPGYVVMSVSHRGSQVANVGIGYGPDLGFAARRAFHECESNGAVCDGEPAFAVFND